MYLAIDEGTTNIKIVLFDDDFNPLKVIVSKVDTVYPREGWVEQDAEEIWHIIRKHLHTFDYEKIRGIGIANQRETTVVWNKRTGKPIYNAIVWQCRRTAPMMQALAREWGVELQQRTGLPMDPYFSASKLKWILDKVPNARALAKKGLLLFGTMDSFLVWKLTGGKVHATDHTNASRTMLYNIRRGEWDTELLDIFGVPESMLPEIRDSADDYGYFTDYNVPIVGVIGDQQASLLAHAATKLGDVKVTYGTGTFILKNTGAELEQRDGLVSTVAWAMRDRYFAWEGSILSSGTVIEWLKTIGLWGETVGEETDLFFVPAFSGLGSPYWDASARGTILGITAYTRTEHIRRAALESIAYMVRDIIEKMRIDNIFEIQADGGMTNNRFLMQFQADILAKQIAVSPFENLTARGAAFAAAIGLGELSIDSLPVPQNLAIYEPNASEEWRDARYAMWRKAVERSRGWSITK